jgi:anti-anti-sigma factor
MIDKSTKIESDIEDIPILIRTFLSRPGELKAVRKDVIPTAQNRGCGTTGVKDLVLAIDEAYQNIIRHAYGDGCEGEITLTIYQIDCDIVVILRDFAECIDVETVKPRELDGLRPGGLGTHFIAEVMDQVKFMPQPAEGGNLLRMVKRISGGGKMKHSIDEENGATVVAFEGEVDLDSSPECCKVLLENIARNIPVLVDLSAVTYIDSFGISSMVEALQNALKSGQEFALAGVSEAAMRVLSLARLGTVFTNHEAREAGLKSLG